MTDDIKENGTDDIEIELPHKFKSWKDISKTNKTIVMICLIFIFITLLVVAINKDTLFKTIEIIKYSDGCNETYINGVINSSNCTYARSMLEYWKSSRGVPSTENMVVYNITS